MDRDAAEDLWGKGRVEAKRLQPDEYGLEGMARYMMKQAKVNKYDFYEQPKGTNRWYASRNLKQPTVYRSVTKLTKRKAEQMVINQTDWEDTFEKLYKSKYKYLNCKPYVSDFTGRILSILPDAQKRLGGRKKNMQKVNIYIDVYHTGNLKKGTGTYSIVLEYMKSVQIPLTKQYIDGIKGTTKYRTEIHACIAALEHIIRPCDIEIVINSLHVTQAVNTNCMASVD